MQMLVGSNSTVPGSAKRSAGDIEFPGTGWYSVLKATIDFVSALVLLLLAGPVILATVLLVKLTSRGPVFYSQLRLGKNGRPYRIYKVRTMYQNCEKANGAQWSTAGDPRITPVGRF